MPDNYFHRLKVGDKGDEPATKRESSFLYLSSFGYAYFKADLKNAFTSNRGTWQDFENYANKHFADLNVSKQNKIIKTQALINMYNATGEAKKEKNAKDKLNELINFVV